MVSNLKLSPLQDDPSSRPESYLRFVIYFMIIAGATISAFEIWKSHLRNPSTAAQVACSVAHDRKLCFTKISSLQRNSSRYSSTANPSMIALSLQVSIKELSKMTPFLETLISNAKREWTVKALRSCRVKFNNSRNILKETLALIGDNPHENFLRTRKLSRDIKDRILDARENIEKCKSRLFLTELYDERESANEIKVKMEEAWNYVDNILRIFYYMDEIQEKLSPKIGNIVNYHYLNTSVFLGLFPFLFLAVLIFLFVKSIYF